MANPKVRPMKKHRESYRGALEECVAHFEFISEQASAGERFVRVAADGAASYARRVLASHKRSPRRKKD